MSTELAVRLWGLPGVKVLVVGDLIYDTDHYGHFRGFSQEDGSCPVFVGESTGERAGGAGAVRAMCEGLGAEAELVGSPHVSLKFRHFVGGKQVFRADKEAEKMNEGESLHVAENVREGVKWADLVLVSDYGKGTCTTEVLNVLKDAPCIFDPHGNPWAKYPTKWAAKSNKKEWDPGSAFRHDTAVRTEGARGLTGFLDGVGTHYPSRKRAVTDVTGCGDVVLATMGVCRAGGLSWGDSCTVANAAAGLKVERRGAVPVTRAEVCLDLAGGKSLPPELLPAVRAAYAGRKVVLATGCFDVLHAGHVSLLSRARGLGQTLVVGVNTDKGVRRLKGPARPRNILKDRVRVLAALNRVDYVVPFEGDTPRGLIKLLRPDVFVKGDDYGREDLPEAGLVERLGGVVVILPRVGGHSTTKLIGAGGFDANPRPPA